MWEGLATEIAVIGIVQLGALIFLLGGMHSDLGTIVKRVGEVERVQDQLVIDVAKMTERCDVICREG